MNWAVERMLERRDGDQVTQPVLQRFGSAELKDVLARVLVSCGELRQRPADARIAVARFVEIEASWAVVELDEKVGDLCVVEHKGLLVLSP